MAKLRSRKSFGITSLPEVSDWAGLNRVLAELLDAVTESHRNFYADSLEGRMKRRTTATAYTMRPEDTYVGVTDTAAPRTVTLPLAADVKENHVVYIKDESGGAGANNITVAGNGSNIDGAANYTIAANYGAARLICSGSAWFSM